MEIERREIGIREIGRKIPTLNGLFPALFPLKGLTPTFFPL
jgi:hypothetical protein